MTPTSAASARAARSDAAFENKVAFVAAVS
jgi:hypothetical protein